MLYNNKTSCFIKQNLICHIQKSTDETKNINGCPNAFKCPSISGAYDTPKWDTDIFNVRNYMHAFPALTSQNVSVWLYKGLNMLAFPYYTCKMTSR